MTKAQMPEDTYVPSEGRSHLDALRPRELTPGYRLLSLLHGRTPSTFCSAALIHGTSHSITTLVLDAIDMEGVAVDDVYGSVDRIITLRTVHPKFAASDPLPSIVAIWAGMVLLDSDLSPMEVCDLVDGMSESDALVRIMNNDLEPAPTHKASGWSVVDKADLWGKSFALLTRAAQDARHSSNGGYREILDRLLRKYTSVVEEVVDEINSGLYDSLPDEWVESSISDILADIRDEFDIRDAR